MISDITYCSSTMYFGLALADVGTCCITSMAEVGEPPEVLEGWEDGPGTESIAEGRRANKVPGFPGCFNFFSKRLYINVLNLKLHTCILEEQFNSNMH